MKRTRLLALALALLLLAACGKKAPAPVGEASPSPSASAAGSPSPSPAASPTPDDSAADGEAGFTVAATEVFSALDPTVVSTAQGVTLTSHLFEGLMRWEAGDATVGGVALARLVPGQAEGYERKVEGETVTYTFHLREDIRWSDGLPVTAQDFVYAWQRLMDPATGATNAYLFLGIQNAADVRSGAQKPAALGVAAPDERTFTVTLEKEPAGFLELCAYPVTYPLRQDVVEAEGGGWSTTPEKFVSNGPYTLAFWSQYSTVTMTPNEEYYGKEALGPERLTFLYAPDDARRMDYLESGTVDFVADLPQEGLEERLKDKDVTLPQTGTYYLQFQTKTAPFDQALVRQAFTLAVDRDSLLAGQDARAADGLVPYGAYGEDSPAGDDFRTAGGGYYDPADLTANFEEARALLAQAGYPGGEGFPEVTYLYNDTEPHSGIAEKLKATWEKELGVTVTLRGESWPNYLYYLNVGQYSIAKNSWTADRADPASFLELLGSERAEAWYGDDGVDNLLDRAGKVTSPSTRMSLLHQAENLILERDWAVCPLFFYQRSYLAGEKVTGVYYLPTGYFFFDRANRG